VMVEVEDEDPKEESEAVNDEEEAQ
jgi:hypothetical protein